jgi:hypothetical protein
VAGDAAPWILKQVQDDGEGVCRKFRVNISDDDGPGSAGIRLSRWHGRFAATCQIYRQFTALP